MAAALLSGDNSYIYDNDHITSTGFWRRSQSCRIKFSDLNKYQDRIYEIKIIPKVFADRALTNV